MTDNPKTEDAAVIRHRDVHASCARCHVRTVITRVPLRLDRHSNELPDIQTIVELLKTLGWALPGPVCPTCQTNKEIE